MKVPGISEMEPVEAACARMAGRRVDQVDSHAETRGRGGDEVERVRFGRFSLIRMLDGSLWILRDDVEAVQVEEERLGAWLELYWEVNR